MKDGGEKRPRQDRDVRDAGEDRDAGQDRGVDPTRRALVAGGAGALALAALGLTGPLLRLVTAPGPVKSGSGGALQPVDLGSIKDLAAKVPGDGTWQPVTGQQVWLRRDEKGLQAISGICTHLGCSLRGEGDGFACPCHSSRFDARGERLSGPARDPLPHLLLTLEDGGRVMLDPARAVDRSFRLPVPLPPEVS